MAYRQFHRYTAKFAPRQDETFVVKPEYLPLIGETITVYYNCKIQDEEGIGYRSLYQGDHEFFIDMKERRNFPVWFSEKDLSEIEPTQEDE